MQLSDIQIAANKINPFIHQTPLLSSKTLSKLVGGEVRLKAENLQRAGAFKIRGALNKILSLTDQERSKGVVAFSSGNHAQGVALAAKLLNLQATIVMPEDAMELKVIATKAYGAEVVQSGVNAVTRSKVAAEIVEKTGSIMVPPFDDPFIVAGQGTIALEIFRDWSEVETIVVPLGGGGLSSGITLAATSINPKIRVYAVEPAAGNDGQESLRTGKIVSIDPPKTIADGARTTAIGQIPFSILRERITDIVTVEDTSLLSAIKLLALYSKLVVEPTGALAVAALLEGKIPQPSKTVAVLSGGNIAPEILAQALTS
ncbi:MAG: threonine/serine dehydratase [Blastocatellia bacterium]|nr:threonine/serine dehydratase [Blastocatellia bacterium]